jgi:hypothetical protein
MKTTTKYYNNKYGVKTSNEIEVVLDKVHSYLNNGSKASYITKCNSTKMDKLRLKFDTLTNYGELVGYTFGDCLA